MKRGFGSRHLIFKSCIAAGFVLGIVLLWQTISTYIYVSGNMMVQAAQRDADQKRASLQRAIRADGQNLQGSVEERPQVNQALSAVLNDSIDEWKEQVAWIRVVDMDGMEVAAAGSAPKGRVSSAQQL